MKKLITMGLTFSLAAGMCFSAMAAPEEDAGYLYGTMEIPYAQFYAAEGVGSDVDAVSSATDSKWKNADLVAGTYYEEHADDDGGDILGVVYPVAISAEDLEALGDDNYAFSALPEAPAAYKTVSVEDGTAVFSAVQGETSPVDAQIEFTTDSGYGDYQINVNAINNSEGTSDLGVIAGVLLKTSDGSTYALRHLENIWRDNLAWSSGITKNEKHGNELKSAQYEDMMGKTISEIVYITDSGYHVLSADLYVPVKFEGGVSVEDAAADAGVTTFSFTGLPEDYAAAYTVDGLDISVDADKISWENAFAGAYSLTVEDEAGVYAPLFTGFTLTTEEVPVVYDADSQSLVAAEGFDDAAAAAFINNIASVSVNGEEYAATGKGAAVIIDNDGWVDSEAAQVKGKGPDAETIAIFPESGDYELTVTANGYLTPVSFTFTVE